MRTKWVESVVQSEVRLEDGQLAWTAPFPARISTFAGRTAWCWHSGQEFGHADTGEVVEGWRIFESNDATRLEQRIRVPEADWQRLLVKAQETA